MSLTRVTNFMIDEAPINPLDYGAIGDGVADDTTAIAACIALEKPIDWKGLTYKITAPITQAVTKDVIWYGNGASIVYSPSAHSEYAIRLTNAGVVDYLINDISISGSKLCNKVFEVLSTGDLVTPASNFVANNLFVSEAKRLNTFNGGDGIFIRGAFDLVRFNGGGARDCELPTGQGTSGTVGIRGIGITWYSTSSFVRRVIISGINILKVYSSDLSYQPDQDGLAYFVPDESVGGNKVRSQFWCGDGSIFANCYGRSIKTQCLETVVDNCQFTKSEGLTAGGNAEVDAQVGGLITSGCIFKYTGGNKPGSCINMSSDAQYGNPSMSVENNRVFLDSSTTLDEFVQTYPRQGRFGLINVSNNNVYGKVKEFFAFLVNGEENAAFVNNNFVKEIVDGVTSAKGLVYLRASGGTSPYKANITANNNYYDDTHEPALVIGSIPGVGATPTLSATNNIGFASSLEIITTATANEVTTSGDIDLVLSTKRGTDSGKITIRDGADQDIDIEPNGDGHTQILGKFLTIGTVPKATALERVAITGPLNSYLNTSYGIRVLGTIPSATTSQASLYRTAANTEAASFTLTALHHYIAQQSTFGAGSTVTNQYGFVVDPTLISATNNYGFFGNIPAGANRWNFFANGTAANAFRGATIVGFAPLATTDNDGFLYVPSCPGTPTGTPPNVGGSLPIVIDSTNHKLYFYSGGTWRDAGP